MTRYANQAKEGSQSQKSNLDMFAFSYYRYDFARLAKVLKDKKA